MSPRVHAALRAVPRAAPRLGLSCPRLPWRCAARVLGAPFQNWSGTRCVSTALAPGVLPTFVAEQLRRDGLDPPNQEDHKQPAAVDTAVLFGEWCAFYINLERRPDRRGRLMDLLARSNNGPLLERLERIEAVDGRNLTWEDEAVADIVEHHSLRRARKAASQKYFTVVHDGTGNLVHFDNHLTLGGIACAMSHKAALERLVSHATAEWALFLEDDVSAVVPRVDLAIARVIQRLPQDWDAVNLAYHDPRGKAHRLALQPAGGPEDLAHVDAGIEVRLFEATQPVFGLGAWMVSKEAARLLVQHAFPVKSQVDFAISNWLVRERGRLFKVDPTALLFYSPCSEEEMDSDVQTMASLDEILAEHKSLENYMDHLHGRLADPEMESALAELGIGNYEDQWLNELRAEMEERWNSGPCMEDWNPHREGRG